MFIALWLISSALVCLGLLLIAWVLMVTAPLSNRPWILRTTASLVVVWDLLFIAFNLGPGDNLPPFLPLSRVVVAVPQGIVTAALVLLVTVGWRDLCDRRVWTTSSVETSRHIGRAEQ
jgi:hypothetical protein